MFRGKERKTSANLLFYLFHLIIAYIVSYYPMLCFVRGIMCIYICNVLLSSIGLSDNTSMQGKKGNAILLCAELVLFYKGRCLNSIPLRKRHMVASKIMRHKNMVQD
jgi:hypothetical protein